MEEEQSCVQCLEKIRDPAKMVWRYNLEGEKVPLHKATNSLIDCANAFVTRERTRAKKLGIKDYSSSVPRMNPLELVAVAA